MNQKVQSQTKYSVVLHCTKTNQSEVRDICFESPPVNSSDIKERIEKQFSIPVCVQVLSFEGYTLKGSVSLSTLKVREGDTFHVKYLAKGDCSELTDIISWLEQLSKAVASESPDLNKMVIIGIQRQMISGLHSFFSQWSDPTSKAYVDKLYFVHNGGLKMIMKVYQFLLQKPWNEMDGSLKCLEHLILISLWSFEQNFSLCRLMIQHNVVQMLTKSLLRVRLEEGKMISDYDTSGNRYQQAFLVETIFDSVGVLLNLIELPDCRLEIAANSDILHQVSCISIEHTLSADYTRRTALFFVYLAFDPQTHQYIADSVYIHRLLRACGRPSTDTDASCLLEYYTLLFLMQVSLISPRCIMSDWYNIITDKMEAFMQANTYKKIRDTEVSNGVGSAIFIPYIKLIYIPNTPPQIEGSSIGKLQLTSLRLAIFSLQTGLGRESQRQTMLKEGLLDFVICMPQYVPPSLRPQAEELVHMVVSSPDIPEGPPKLLNLVKARLAKMHFGLEQVLSFSVSEIGSNFS